MTFDPYYQWLGIPPEEQPPHHYRLLGIKPLEENLDVIETAADRQMLHLRTYQAGKHAELSQRLLNEVAAAKITLLDPTKKQPYDDALRTRDDSAVAVFEELPPEEFPRSPPDATIAGPVAYAPVVVRPLPVAAPLPVQPLLVAQALPIDTAPHPFVGPPAMASPTGAVRMSRRPRRFSSASPWLLGSVFGGSAAALVALLFVASRMTTSEDDSDPATSIVRNDPAPSSPIRPQTDPPDRRPTIAAPPTPISTTVTSPDSKPAPVDVTIAPVDQGPLPQTPLPEATTTPVRKLPVPPAAARGAEAANIARVFDTAAATTPAEKAKTALVMLQAGRALESEPLKQFVVLNAARELAADAGRLQAAFEAIALLDERFEFDADDVRMAAIGQGVKAAIPAQQKQEVVDAGIVLASNLSRRDRYDDASRVLLSLIDLARRAGDAKATAQLAALRRQSDALAAEYRRVEPALRKLAASPDDAAANLIVGRFLLFAKHDAARGLHHLARGGNDPLAVAAAAERKNPPAADDQVAVADAWWDLAASDDDKSRQRALYGRARAWYEKARPALTGIAAAKVTQRLSDLQSAGIAVAETELDFSSMTDEPVALPAPLVTRGLVAYWPFDEGEGEVALDCVGGHAGLMKGAAWTDGVRGRALRFDGQKSFVALGDPADLNFEGAISLCAWIRAASEPANNAPDWGRRIIIEHGERWHETFLRTSQVYGFDGGTYLGDKARADAFPKERFDDLNTWVHLATTCDGERWRIYRNGALVGEDVTGLSATKFAGGWAIGACHTGKRRFFHGDIDEVRIYNRGLTAEEVAILGEVRSAAAVKMPSSPSPSPTIQAELAVEGKLPFPVELKEGMPQELKGAIRYTWTKQPETDMRHGIVSFSVVKPGLVWIAATFPETQGQGNRGGGWFEERTTRAQLVEQGWEDLGAAAWNSGHIVLSKFVKAGETYRFRTNKYWPPEIYALRPFSDVKEIGAPTVTMSGIWRSSTGTVFQIADDGAKLDIRLFSSRHMESLSGILLRDGTQLTKQQWQGVFKGDPKRRTWDLRIEAEVFDDDTILTNYEEIIFGSQGEVIARKFPNKGVLKRVRDEE